MNDQTTQLIEKLAEKLGTTSEYLWGILIKQAYIDACINSIIAIVVLIIAVVIIKLHLRFSKTKNFYDYNEGVAGIMIFASFITGALIIGCFIMVIPNIFNGFLNPEYWALNEILKSLNPT